MDLADRGTLSDRLGHGGVDSFSLNAIVTALAESLSVLHASGYVHRDVSPGNLLIQSRTPSFIDADKDAVTVTDSGLIGGDERLLLGDLGLAKNVVTSAAVTVLGGTPRYSSPEQLNPRGEVGPATDVYGATAVLWKVFTGDSPPQSHQLEAALDGIDERWHDFMRCGMAPYSKDRFSSIRSWQAAAKEALGESGDAESGSGAGRYAADECPYQGLAAFQARDSDRFFGRDELVLDLVGRLRQHRVLVVGGASGSGKSSLVRAGLIPAIRAGALPDSAQWPAVVFAPGADPLKELEYQLRKLVDNLQVNLPDDFFSATDDTRWRRMVEYITDATGGILICIDQFEELFTFNHERKTLDHILAAFASMSDPSESLIRLVFVIRADFYASASRFPWLAEVISRNQVLVGPMTRKEMHKAITEPARRARLSLDKNLVDAVLEDSGATTGTLPLVSHALAETWKLRSGNRLTLENYHATGGMFGAITQSAEALYSETLNPDEQHVARCLLLRLISPGQGVPDTRRPIAVTDLQDTADNKIIQHVLAALVEARLLTIDSDIVQLAHEAIILTWPRMQDWINESRDDMRVLQRIQRVASEWHEAGRDPDLLYHGTPLLSALEWFESHKDNANALETEFLTTAADAEAAARQRELIKANRARRNRRWAFTTLVALLVASLISSVIAFNAFRRARTNEVAANFRLAQSLAAQAVDLADRDPGLALALAAEVMARETVAPVDARAALVKAAATIETTPFTPFSSLVVGDALTVALHPTRDLLLTGNRDGSVAFWNTAGSSLGNPVKAHSGAIEEFAFSPDGNKFLSASLDGTIMSWVINENGQLPKPKLALDLATLLWSVAFSPDGNKIAIAAEDGTVRILNADDFNDSRILTDNDRDFLTVQFSPDNQLLLAGNGRGEVWGWRTSDGELLTGPFPAHESDVWEIVFFPDSASFATASSDGRVRVWDTRSEKLIAEPFAKLANDARGIQIDANALLVAGDETGRLLFWNKADESTPSASIAHHDAQVIDAASQLSGSLLVFLGLDQVMSTWRGSVEKSYQSLEQHETGAFGLALSADSQLVATGDGSGHVRLFDTVSGQAVGVPLTLSAERVWSVAFDEAGHYVAAGDEQGTLALWDVETGRRIARIKKAHDGSITTLAFHSEKKLLVSAGADGLIRRWNTESLKSIEPELSGHTGGVMRFVFSPDGLSLVAADRTGGIHLWDFINAEIEKQWQADDNTIWSLAWSADGKTLATAHADEVVKLWDLQSGAVLQSLTPHPGGATDVAFLPDGVTLVSASRDGTVRLWDRDTGLRLGEAFAAGDKPIWRLAISQQASWFATSNADGSARVWKLFDKQLICRQATWDATAQRRYLGAGELPRACRNETVDQ